jgi:hypothetical protein
MVAIRTEKIPRDGVLAIRAGKILADGFLRGRREHAGTIKSDPQHRCQQNLTARANMFFHGAVVGLMMEKMTIHTSNPASIPMPF